MKKEYLKPDAEYVKFYSTSELSNGNMSGDILSQPDWNTGDMEEGWE